ncbi:hypothetical protein Btru_052335 [Bulinus truncatus]|nr:hypothetical protein Btru_052335 [Bulinus truncatus]
MLFSQLKKWFLSQKRKRKKYIPIVKAGVNGKSDNITMTAKPMSTVFVKECGYIPAVLTNGAAIIEKNLKTKDLFQIQGSAAKINFTLSQLGVARATRLKNVSVHDVIEAMKTYLVRLPEPLLPDDVSDSLIKASPDEDRVKYRSILFDFRQSQPHNFAILHFMMVLFKKVAEHATHNSMDVRKLATIFVLDVINPLKIDDPTHGSYLIERMQRLPYLIMVIENMINNVHIFNNICQMKGTVSPIRGASSMRVQSTPPRKTRSSSVAMTSSFPNQSHYFNLAEANHGDGVKSESGELEIRKRFGLEDWSPGVLMKQKSVAQSTDVDAADDCVAQGQGHFCDAELAESRDLSGQSADLPNVAAWRTKRLPGRSPFKAHRRFTSPSPKVRKSSKSRSEYSTEMRPPRSLDRKHDSKGRHGQCATEAKKKRKSRSAHRTHQATRVKPRSQSQDSDYSAFQADEEMSPWNDVSNVSDDTSVMAKTIRYPRVLSVGPEVKSKTSHQLSRAKVDHVWRCQYKNDAAPAEEAKKRPSPTLIAFESSVSPSKVDNNKSVAMPQRVKLIKENTETFRYTLMQSDKVDRRCAGMLPGKTKPLLEMFQLDTKISNAHFSEYNKAISTQTTSRCLKKKTTTPVVRMTPMSNTAAPVCPGQTSSSSRGSEERVPAGHKKFKVVLKDTRQLYDIRHRHNLGHICLPPRGVPRDSRPTTSGERLMDFVLVCITILCTCLVFYIHQYSQPVHSEPPEHGEQPAHSEQPD